MAVSEPCSIYRFWDSVHVHSEYFLTGSLLPESP